MPSDSRRRGAAAGRILINGRAAARPEIGGVERWARELSARLPALRPGAYETVNAPRGGAFALGQAWEQGVLPLVAARRRAALVLSPANLAPVAWPRNVVVIHDVAALREPRWYRRRYVAWQRRVLPVVARRALGVIAPSQFSRGEIVELLGADPARVTVIPGGVDGRFRPDAAAEDARRALGLDRPYVLSVATAGPRKNLAALAPVAGALSEDGLELVVAGGGRGYLPPAPAGGRARAIGYVDDSLMPGLYAGARAFVLPSHQEGFGLTCLEAMAAGTPVVAADRGALPETCGDAALLVDPDDPAALVDAVVRAAREEDTRARLTAAGVARAAELSWDRAARAVDDLLAGLAYAGAP